jgi:ABC-2 type transport system permease protein
MSRTRTTFEMGLREYARTPVLLALLVFLPAYVILFFTWAVPERTVPVDVPGAGLVPVGLKPTVAALMTPMVAALIGGIAGLFLMQSARDVDSRLVVVGAAPRTILFARFGLLGFATLLASAVAVTVMSLTYVPDQLVPFVAATVVSGLTYGAIGILVGLVLNRLAGIYVMMFGPFLDIFLAQSPLSEGAPAVAPYLPGHYTVEMAFDAAFTAGVDLATLAGGLAYLAVVAALAWVAFFRSLRST